MYDVEKCFAALENVAGFTKLDAYIYNPVTKWQHWGMFIHWGNKLYLPPECCTAQNTTGARFLKVQIPLCVLVYDWDPCAVSSAGSTQYFSGKNKKEKKNMKR